jgi:cytidine deaminase
MAKIRENEKKLLQAALNAVDKAYVLWGFRVGAAVLAEDGQVYEGCNVESWVSGLGICAERCAIDHAILHGNKKIREIAIVMDADKRNEPRPCGACLQYIHDFAKNSKTEIIIAKAQDQKILIETVDVKTIGELLPSPYKK